MHEPETFVQTHDSLTNKAMTSSTTTAESSAGVEPASGYCQTPGSPQYERLRTRYFNDKLPPNRPVEIATPTSSLQVCDTISRAASRGLKVGVRSGGHLFPACSLVDGGVLIDTGHLNRAVEYDAATKLAAFGPGVTVEEAERSLTSLGRFFPFGHHPSVGLGGFLLAGGQGWFTRGSGYTTDAWIERLEVVMPNAQLITASRQEHTDVFWAVRGSGQGCFGVVTKIWVRTVPARTLYDRTLMLDITDDYQQQLKSVLETCDLVPKQGTDIALVTHWSDIMDAGDHWETRTKRLVLSISLSAYADSIGEAKTMLSPFSSPQDNNAFHIIADMAVKETTWQNMWDMQNFLFPSTERWQIDSILTDRVVSYSEVWRGRSNNTVSKPLTDPVI